MEYFAKRIIPCLDVNDGRVVKGVNFVNLRDAGDPVEVINPESIMDVFGVEVEVVQHRGRIFVIPAVR